MDYSQKLGIIRLSKKEIMILLDFSKKSELVQKVIDRNLAFSNSNDWVGIKTIVDGIADRTANHRDEHEVFVAAFCVVDFFGTNSKICFEIDNRFNPKIDRVDTLQDLNRWRSGSDSDFIILSGVDYRFFQLKRYRGLLMADDAFNYLAKILGGYGNNLHDINLLILIQSQDNVLPKGFFREINARIGALGLDFHGHIMFLFNDNCKQSIIKTVFPIFSTSKLPWILPSSNLHQTLQS